MFYLKKLTSAINKIMEQMIVGEWLSRYTIQADTDNPKTYEHTIVFSRKANGIIGYSQERDSGSELVLRLRYDAEDSALTGTWGEKTSLDGAYKGAVFHGALQLLLNDTKTQAQGKWVGFNTAHSRVKTGDWHLEKK